MFKILKWIFLHLDEFSTWVRKDIDDVTTFGPLILLIFSKLSGLGATVLSGLYAAKRRTEGKKYKSLIIVGLGGGIASSQAWFNIPFGAPMGVKSILVTLLFIGISLIIWKKLSKIHIEMKEKIKKN